MIKALTVNGAVHPADLGYASLIIVFNPRRLKAPQKAMTSYVERHMLYMVRPQIEAVNGEI